MEHKQQLIKQEHRKTIWTNYVCVLLGLWLLTGHAAFGYTSQVFVYNDIVVGLLLIIFGLFAVSHKNPWAPWIICLLGVWLQFCPLLFWAPNPSIYVNETLIGALVFAFSIIIPGMPGQLAEEGPSIPSGWSYNPSSFPQRMPIILLGCIGWFISRYLAAFQLGYIDYIWDPFFDHGTLNVITSSVSKSFPISDAGLGAFAYSLEVLLALKGGERRWKTMPWISLLFGLLVVPLGLVSITLIILQPVIVGSWCTLCLITAFCMVVMIALGVDEMIAVIQFLLRKKRDNKSLIEVFFKGATDPSSSYDLRTPPLDAPIYQLIPSMVWGVGIPWNLALSALVGIFLMICPSLFELSRIATNIDSIIGALTIVVSICSMAEVIRKLRVINLVLGALSLLSTLVFDLYFSGTSIFVHLVIGALLILLSFPQGKINETYGK